MWCSESLLNLLGSYGYCVIRIPKADVKPLQVLFKKGRYVERLGEITSLFRTGNSIPLPLVIENTSASNISGQRTSNLKIGIGISLLGGILDSMGGSSFDLESKYRQAKTITFEFSDVLEDRVELIKLDQYLTDADINPFSRHLTKLLESDQVYIITATIKSHKLTVEAKNSDGIALALSIPEIQKTVGGNIKVSGKQKVTSRLTYEGNVPLVFGFQAVQLFYNQGHYTAFESQSDLIMRSRELPLSTHKKLVPEGLFMHIDSD